jgi:hypothetical protein
VIAMMVKNSATKLNRGKAAAVGLLAALGAFASMPASALPVGAMGTGVARPATELPVENVGCRNCAAVGVGVAAGVIAGAAIAGAANNNRRTYYDEPEVVYAPRAYGPPRNRCWVQNGPYRGDGYWGRC